MIDYVPKFVFALILLVCATVAGGVISGCIHSSVDDRCPLQTTDTGRVKGLLAEHQDLVSKAKQLEVEAQDFQKIISSYAEQISVLQADKLDLIRQKTRLEAEVQDFQKKVPAYVQQVVGIQADKKDLIRQKMRLEGEVQDLQEKFGKITAYSAVLEQYKLPKIGIIGQNGFSIVAENNEIRSSLTDIRFAKHRATDLKSLWAQLTPYAKAHKQFHDARDLAIGAMLVVGAFYDFGNPPPNENLPGCVSINITNDLRPVDELTFDAHMKSEIGCCTDFTMMLGSFLKYLGYEREVIINSAHQCLRVKIDDHWHILDSTALVFAESFFSSERCTLHYYTPYPNNRTIPFQHFVIKSLALKIEPYRLLDWSIVPVRQNNTTYRAKYLDAEDRQ